MQKRVHVFISGNVQGVYFRANTMDWAAKLGLKGFVRNTDDGRVEAIFEGKESAVKEIIRFCRKGPEGARVADVKIRMEKYKGEFKDFKVKY